MNVTRTNERLTCHYNVVNVLRAAALGQVVLDPVNVVDVEEAALWPPEEAGEVFNGVALGGRVDDAEDILEMVE